MILICKIANRWLNIFPNEKVRWKKYCARGKAGRRQPNCRGFYLFFADILAVFVSPLAVCCWCGGTFVVFCSTNYNARVRGTRTPLTRSGDTPQGGTYSSSDILSNYSAMGSINFPFTPFLPIFYLITLKWHCRPTKKSKNLWNFQMEQPVCFSLGSGHVLELHHIKGKRSIECQKFWWVVPIAIEVATVINWRGCAHWQLVYIN